MLGILMSLRWILLLFACAGCATAAAPAQPSAPPAAPLDDAAALQRAQAFFDTVDRRDLDAFRAIVTAGFVLFEEGQTLQPEALSGGWAASNQQRKPVRTRTCDGEAVHRGPGSFVYIGRCTEHVAAFGDAPAQEWQGWNTVVLVPDGRAWKVALWQWQRGGIDVWRERWNDAYRRGTTFIKEPNQLLVSTIAGVTPGTALDVAMGQGRNALFLASRGWKVTGVDIADEGIRQARAAAAERGLSIDAVTADLDAYDFGTARWDLVTMIYAGSSMKWVERIKPSLRPGGLFVFEFSVKDPSDSQDWGGIEPAPLVAAFAGWEILKNEIVEDIPDWGKSKARLFRFVARKR